MKAIEQKKNENKENGPIKTKYRFSHKGLDCYILTSGWVEKRGQTEMTVDKTHVGVCEDLDFETPKLKSFAEAKKQVIKHIDEGKKDIGMNSLSKKKLAVIKSNAAPEVKLRDIMSNVKHNSGMTTKQGRVRGQLGEYKYGYNEPSMFEWEILGFPPELSESEDDLYFYLDSKKPKNKSDLEKAILELDKKYMTKFRSMKKNSIERKQLAIIKSNAAPEVKLKALEKLNENAIKSNDARQDVVRLAQQLVKMCDEVKQNIKSLESEAKRPADDDFVAKDILEELKDIQVHLKQAKEYRY